MRDFEYQTEKVRRSLKEMPAMVRIFAHMVRQRASYGDRGDTREEEYYVSVDGKWGTGLDPMLYRR